MNKLRMHCTLKIVTAISYMCGATSVFSFFPTRKPKKKEVKTKQAQQVERRSKQ